MSAAGWFLVAVIVLLPLLVVLEGKRQQRKWGAPSGRGGSLRGGFLELQRHLEPQRKMEILLDEKGNEISRDAEGDPPTPGPSGEAGREGR